MPTEEEIGKYQHVMSIMNQTLQEKGLIKVAEGKIYVTRLKGPLEEGWQKKLECFASRVPICTNDPEGLSRTIDLSLEKTSAQVLTGISVG